MNAPVKGNDVAKIQYETESTRVPVTAHNLIRAAAKKHGIRVCDAYVEAAMLLAKKLKVEVK